MVSARQSRGRSARRDQARQRLLNAIESELEEGSSFASMTVEGLAVLAGISRAGFYIHFQDKLELLEEWLHETRAALLETATPWYSAAPTLDRPFLRGAIGEILHAHRAGMTLMLAAHEAAQYDPAMRDDFAQAFEEHVAALTAHIEAGQRSADINAAVPPRQTAEWIICMLDRVPLRIPDDTSEAALEAHFDVATGIVWSALYEPARPGQ